MLRSLCGSAPLWQFPYAKMKSDLGRELFCDCVIDQHFVPTRSAFFAKAIVHGMHLICFMACVVVKCDDQCTGI